MRNLKRALSLGLTAAMISGLMVMGSSAASYADVTSEDNVEAIDVLEAVGIMIGDESGNFNPDQNVTRNEMAVVMSNLMEYNVASYRDTSPFTDVPSWAEPYVAACWANGITAGYSDTIYGGSDTVTTAQAALMLMKALGYFQYSSDFGSDWQLSTVRQGNDIDLFVGVDSGVEQAMTRNDVAQLVLNTLEAGTVQPTTNGSITVGDVTIVNNVEYNYITSNADYADAIYDNKSTDQYTDANRYIVELGEQLYMGDLQLKESYDNFNRPSRTWEYQRDEIGTYNYEADYTYTIGVAQEDLFDELGANIVLGDSYRGDENAYDWDVYYNGENLGDVRPERNNDDDYSETARGTLTQVYVDDEHRQVLVTMIDTFLAEVVNVREDDDATTVTLNYLGNEPANTHNRQSSIELESTDLESGDKVLVNLYENGSRFSIDSMELAETVTGEVTAVRAVYNREETGTYATMDGSDYYYVGNTFAADLADTELENPALNTNTILYLDYYGNMIAFEATDRSVDYLYVMDAHNGVRGVDAYAVFPDGTGASIHVDKFTDTAGNVDNGSNVTVNGIFGSPSIRDGVFAYVQDGENYELTALDRANDDGISGTDNENNTWTQSPAYQEYDKGFSVDDLDTRNKELGTVGSVDTDHSGANVSYSIQNGENAIRAEYSTGTPASAEVVPLTNSTIFVDVDGARVYTGFDEVIDMDDINFYVVYNRQGNADVVFITENADKATADSYFFVLEEKSYTTESNGTRLYQYDVIRDNEETTITMRGTNLDDNQNRLVENALYKIESINPDGEITEVSCVTTLNGSGNVNVYGVPGAGSGDFGMGYSASNNVAVSVQSNTLRIENDADIAGCGTTNDLSGYGTNGMNLYRYNSDTTFVEITMDENGDFDDVDFSNVNAINTTTDNVPGNSTVFVLAVEDEDNSRPLATLVYVVNWEQDFFNDYRVTVTNNVAGVSSYSMTDVYGDSFVSGDRVMTGNVTLTLTGSAAPGYNLVVTANGTRIAQNIDGTYTIPVTSNTNIVIAEEEDTNPVTVTVADASGYGARVVFKDVNTGDQVASVADGRTVSLARGTEYEVEVTLGNSDWQSVVTLTATNGTVSTVGGFYYMTPVTGTDTLTVDVNAVTVTLNPTVTGEWALGGVTEDIDATGEVPYGATVTLAQAPGVTTKWTANGDEFDPDALGVVTDDVVAQVYNCYKVTFTVTGGNCATYNLDPASATQYLEADEAAHIKLTETGGGWTSGTQYVLKATGFNDADITTDNTIEVDMAPTAPLTSDLVNVKITWATKS